MKDKNYTIAFTVNQSPEEVFNSVNNVRGWWSEEIQGRTDKLGAEFKFSYEDLHHSTHQITEFLPGRRVVWHVPNARINFVKDKAEWDGTDIIFEISRKSEKTELCFTHAGLVPAIECYDNCSGAWGFYISESLYDLITKGKGQPNEKGKRKK
jgi:hypothetical protein